MKKEELESVIRKYLAWFIILFVGIPFLLLLIRCMRDL